MKLGSGGTGESMSGNMFPPPRIELLELEAGVRPLPKFIKPERLLSAKLKWCVVSSQTLPVPNRNPEPSRLMAWPVFSFRARVDRGHAP
jgi:hypothetical protein